MVSYVKNNTHCINTTELNSSPSLPPPPWPPMNWDIWRDAFGRPALLVLFSNLNTNTLAPSSRDVRVYVSRTYIRNKGIKKSLVLQVSVRKVHLKRINIAGTARAGLVSLINYAAEFAGKVFGKFCHSPDAGRKHF